MSSSNRSREGKIILFGDQTTEFAPSLKRVIATAKQSSPLVRKFLGDAVDVVRIEARGVSSDEGLDVETLSSLISSPDDYEKLEDRTGVIQTVLTCVSRLGELLLHAEQDPTIVNWNHNSTRIQALGLCTGLLPAAALAAAQDIQDLAHLALLMVGVAFRLRIELHRRSTRVEAENGIWGYLVVGQTVDEIESALDGFHNAKNIPIHKRAYVAVASDAWSAVFGPPSTMRRLFKESSFLSGVSVSELYRANGAVHAPHLPELDMKEIIGTDHPLLNRQLSPNIQVMSTSECQPYRATTLGDLLRQVLYDILILRLDMNGATKAVASTVPTGSSVQLVVVGGSNAVSTVQSALDARKATVTVVDQFSLRPAPALRNGSGKIAIIGVGGRFPGSESVDDFWKSLLDAKEFHRLVPESRFALDAWQHALGPDASLPYGCFLDRPGQFDARLFNISPREAAQMEPMHRLLMLVTYEALETAGYAPNATPATDKTRISTFFGQSSDDWRDVNHQAGIDTHYIPATARAFGAGRLHHFFKWEGPAFTVDAACGSSAVAISLACASLARGDCDMAVAGGAMLVCSPDAMAGLAKGGFLSPTGSCKTFRADVDGYCRGEAVASVVLKRLEDAQLDNDNILGVVDGWARNHAAYASSITHPHQPSQERVFQQVLRASGVQPTDIGYVEAHGTGTTAGDLCEVNSITNVFGGKRTADNPLILGAVKANVGHAEAGAAIVALIKVAMMLKNNGTIPPQPGFENPVNPAQLNPEFPSLASRHIHVANGRQTLKAGQKIVLNCFDATGGNTSFVISPPPAPKASLPSLPASMVPDETKDPRTHQVVVCSGHTFTVMKKNERRILDYLMNHKNDPLRDLAYTSTARRMKHHAYRTAWVVTSTKELGRRLLEDTSKTESNLKRPGSVAFTFTGQGAAYRGMAKRLFNTSPRFRKSVLEAERICEIYGFPSVVDYIQGDELTGDTRRPHIKAGQEQLATAVLQLGLVDLLHSWNLKPDVIIGHSLGEYAGLCTAGVLSVSDTIYLVGKRAGLLGEHCQAGAYSMLVLPLASQEASSLAADHSGCCVACKNTSSTTVISGPTEAISAMRDAIRRDRGMEAKTLPIAYGFHSEQMEQIASGVESLAQNVHFTAPKTPVASTLLGRLVREEGTFNAQYMARQTREAVDFVAALEATSKGELVDDKTVWVEIGPDTVNIPMVRKTLGAPDKDRFLPTLSSGNEDWAVLANLVASCYCRGLDIDWHAYHRDYESSLRLVELHNYAFDLKDYWRAYVHPKPEQTIVNGSNPTTAMSGNGVPNMPYLTPFLQYLTHESVQADGAIQADFVSKMIAAAQGHLVDGTPIFPGSAFCEMAYAAADYLIPKHQKMSEKPHISSLMNRPLIISTSNDDSVVHTTAVCDSHGVQVKFSVTSGPDTNPLGQVCIRYDRGAALQTKTGPTSLFLVKARMNAVIQAVRGGEGHSVIYQLFERYIGYGPGFQGIEECFLSQDRTEAACTVRLPASPSATGERDAFNMYWRYMLNGHPDGPPTEANIAVAVKEILFEDNLNSTDTFQVYTHMHPTESGFIGDVYLIGLCSDMVYKTVSPRRAGSKTKKPATQKQQDVADLLLELIANETGWPVEVLEDNTELADMGVDSLMNIVLVSKIRAEKGIEISAAKFRQCFTVADIRNAFGNRATPPPAVEAAVAGQAKTETGFVDEIPEIALDSSGDEGWGSETSSSPVDGPVIISRQESTDTDMFIVDRKSAESIESGFNQDGKYVVEDFLIQGEAKEGVPYLFLVPDGSGSVTSFFQLPQLSTNLCVYGLHSPWVKEPEAFTCTIEQATELYLAAIRARQPHGPYLLGGWSSGCVFAYESARLLLEAGEEVLGLIIIDMHCPRPLPEWIDTTRGLWEYWCETTGLNNVFAPLPDGADLEAHLISNFRALNKYHPKPMASGKRPKHGTLIIWAKKGMGNGLKREDYGDFPDPLGLGEWFCFDRNDFGPNGWEELVGDQINCVAIDGHHRSIMVPPDAYELVKTIDDGLRKFLA
ncbi:LOW QUALITY PROTEIN: polyketide synthase [Colletotrichum navitas]|uniref:Polyketide synthase n=1 Tax=Colletotrichum navitas TaxID=681940 RepID=A0AAD8PTS8_9PEZI|nr:LOW QUALITY PROTEIN: polyketide synthase [Colletotrichum navitas]KAK1580585.1 LOW QUALITY PROTEIN: polyketide synthase [Colletotrichum navitas]